MNKKKLLVLALVLIMITSVSFGTLAWFNDSATVTNKFMIAGSDDPSGEKIFSVGVWEDVNGDGVADTTNGYTYNNVLPGDKLTKVAKVQNTGAYDQYIRIVVEISDAAAWQSALGQNFNDETMLACFDGYDKSLWRRVESEMDTAKDVIRITMYYNGGANSGIVAPNEAVTVFTAVNIPTSLTQEQAAKFTGSFEIKVTADAIQTENLGIDTANSVCDAYEAFKAAGLA